MPKQIQLTEGIKYAGSKLKLLAHIIDIIKTLPDVKTVLDGFSGSTRVAQALAQNGYKVTANDIAPWSSTFALCYLKASKPDSFYADILKHLNSLPGQTGWFSENYGGALSSVKKPFQLKNMQKLDAIRPALDKLNLASEDNAVILTSLILALDRVDSTLGHFASYLNKWSARSHNDMVLKLPHRFIHDGGHSIFKGDVFDIAATGRWDIAYFDPPYGSNNAKMPPSRVRYNAYYHFWASVINYDKPALFGKANRREDSRDVLNKNPFEDFRGDAQGSFAMQAISKLIDITQAKYILLSYSSGGRATWGELQTILSRHGRLVSASQIDYRQNVMASMVSTKVWAAAPAKHKEYLFLLQK